VELQEAFLQFGLGDEEVPQPPPQEAPVAASAAMGMDSPSWACVDQVAVTRD